MFAFNHKYGRKVVWALVLSEWLNQVLKLILRGHRPYWWVKIAANESIDTSNLPEIKQFHLTCETGPGSPSGHAMITAAVWYIIFHSFLEFYNRKNLPLPWLVSLLCWTTHFSSIVGVSLSRLYISAHFPHQCVLGAFLGIVVAFIMTKTDLNRFKVFSYVVITIFMFTSVLTCFAGMNFLGIDPNWSVELAKAHCIKSEYVHLDTTPLFSLNRYTAYFLGFGLGFVSPLLRATRILAEFTFAARIATAIISLLISLTLVQITIPKDDLMLFYFFTFILYTAHSFIFTAVVPYVVQIIWPTGNSFPTVRVRTRTSKRE